MATGDFAMRFEQVMFYLGPIVQVLYWTIVSVCAVAAVRLFKRWVDHATGSKTDADGGRAHGEPRVDVEPFVE